MADVNQNNDLIQQFVQLVQEDKNSLDGILNSSQVEEQLEASLEARLVPKDNSLHPLWRCSDSK
jgi:hypothetical protein